MAVSYAELRDWALTLPGTREVYVEAWGRVTLRVGDKMFASSGEGHATASVKASPEDQAELIATAPEVYARAPYSGRFGWVQVTLANADAPELRRIVEDAWRRTAPKRLVRAYGAGPRR